MDSVALDRTLRTLLTHAAPWVEHACGHTPLDRKSPQGVSSTPVHEAVTQVDLDLQDHILRGVLAEFPSLVPLAEESTPLARVHRGTPVSSAIVIDPIDGTQTFAHGRHDYSTLVALSNSGRLEYGLVARYHPLTIQSTVAPDLPGPRSPSDEGSLRVVCHYRTFLPPFAGVARRLEAGGCRLSSVPAAVEDLPGLDDSWQTGPGLGSNGASVMALLAGQWDAYVAPMVALHDFAGPWCLAAAAGAAVVQFDTPDPARPNRWIPRQSPWFGVEAPEQYPRRFRILIARSSQVATRLTALLGGAA